MGTIGAEVHLDPRRIQTYNTDYYILGTIRKILRIDTPRLKNLWSWRMNWWHFAGGISWPCCPVKVGHADSIFGHKTKEPEHIIEIYHPISSNELIQSYHIMRSFESFKVSCHEMMPSHPFTCLITRKERKTRFFGGGGCHPVPWELIGLQSTSPPDDLFWYQANGGRAAIAVINPLNPRVFLCLLFSSFD